MPGPHIASALEQSRAITSTKAQSSCWCSERNDLPGVGNQPRDALKGSHRDGLSRGHPLLPC